MKFWWIGGDLKFQAKVCRKLTTSGCLHGQPESALTVLKGNHGVDTVVIMMGPTATQEQRALNIFGSYGSGKSHLAVVMAHLLRDGSGDIAFEHFFERLRNFGESTLAENLKNTFLNSNDVDAKPLKIAIVSALAPQSRIKD